MENSNEAMSSPKELTFGAVIYSIDNKRIHFAVVHNSSGYWSIPQVSLNSDVPKNEYKNTVVKNIKEDLGIDIVIKKELGDHEYTAINENKAKEQKNITCLLAETPHTPLSLAKKDKYDDIKWCPVEDLETLKLYDGILPIVKEAVPSISLNPIPYKKLALAIVVLIIFGFVYYGMFPQFATAPTAVNDIKTNKSATTKPLTATETPPKTISKEQLAKLSKAELVSYITAGTRSFAHPQIVASTTDAVNCFDYYKFGSVQVNVSPSITNVAPSATLNFSGEIKNTNNYPIVDGQVYIKIFYKNQKNESLTHQNGFQVVDEFIAKDNIDLKAYENKPISFNWKVPQYAQTGDYQVATYFTSAYRYNLLGLTFTDDVTGNKANFSIVSNNPKISYFDKNNVLLNNIPFQFAGYPPHFTKDEKVTAHVTVINPNDRETAVAITWKTYAWDAMLDSNLRETKTEIITLKPNEKKLISHDVPIINNSVSYFVAELKEHDAKSILNIRLIRDGIEETRINFPSTFSYPIEKGKQATIFSCVHSTNQPVVKDNILTLTLKDSSDQVVHTYSYKGDVTGAMMGIKDSFIPKETLSTFSLTAKLERNGQVFEEVKMVYDCNKIDTTQCKKGLDVKNILIILGSIVVILIAVGIIIKKKGVSSVKDNQNIS